MSAVPQGAFAVFKVKQASESDRNDFCRCGNKEEEGTFKKYLSDTANLDQSPLKYSSKLMNSIWGLYNQYSVHNLKKNKNFVAV